MSKKLALEIQKNVDALVDIEIDALFDATLANEPQAAKLADHARTLRKTLENVWAKTRTELTRLSRTPDFEPIHTLLLEVIAAKAAATNRRRAERAKALAKAFSLEERAHIKS